VHPGTYSEGVLRPSSLGEEAQPIAVRAVPGQARPRIMATSDNGLFKFEAGVRYWVLEGLDIDMDRRDGNAVSILGGHHILVRGNLIRNGKAGAAVQVRGLGGGQTTDVLIHGNEITGFHRWSKRVTDPQTGQQREVFAFTRADPGYRRRDANAITIEGVANGVIERVEVRGNQLHHVGGDGLQCIGVDDELGESAHDPKDIDIVDNRVYSNAEDAVDIKSCQQVSIRGSDPGADKNKFFSFRPLDQSAEHGLNRAGGTAIGIHYFARNVLVENTRIWDACQGIIVGREDKLVRNVVIRRTLLFGLVGSSQSKPDNPCFGRGIRIGRAEMVHVYHVTIDNGVTDQPAMPGRPPAGINLGENASATNPLADVKLWNNIIVVDGAAGVWLDVDRSKLKNGKFENDYNVLWHPDNSPSHFRLLPRPSGQSSAVVDLGTWRSRTGQDQHSHRALPRFVPQPTLNDYYTELGSPARNAALDNVCAPGCGGVDAPDIGFLESCQ
jgi:hypothetical protein